MFNNNELSRWWAHLWAQPHTYYMWEREENEPHKRLPSNYIWWRQIPQGWRRQVQANFIFIYPKPNPLSTVCLKYTIATLENSIYNYLQFCPEVQCLMLSDGFYIFMWKILLKTLSHPVSAWMEVQFSKVLTKRWVEEALWRRRELSQDCIK